MVLDRVGSVSAEAKAMGFPVGDSRGRRTYCGCCCLLGENRPLTMRDTVSGAGLITGRQT